MKPANRQVDPDSITDEERFMFRKLGLRMKAFLLLGTITLHPLNLPCPFLFTMNFSWDIVPTSGRRRVFDGTVKNLHLH